MSDGELSVSRRRMKSLLAAEDVCKQVRYELSNNGSLTGSSVDYLLRWMSLTGKHKYELPNRMRKK